MERLAMKMLILILIVLASSKVGWQEYLAYSAKSEIIVAAYRDRAATACDRDSRGRLASSGALWDEPRSTKLVIGKPALDVQLWQLNHPSWQARFKNPYLVLSAGDGLGRVFCEFDIVHGTTTIGRL
jgi:hypothetical protein